MERQPVVHGRVYHNRKRTRLYRFKKWSKMLLAHILHCNGRRSTVFTAHRHAVSHVMFQTSSHMIRTNLVRVFTLETKNRLASHFGIQVGIFTVVLPLASPTRVASQVNHRCVSPRNTTCLCFIGRYARTFTSKLTVERCSHVNTLWKEGSACRISCSMYLVNPVNTRNTYLFHGFVLNTLNDFLPFGGALCHSPGHIQN
ncbi:hypothetical protein SDC9_102528 [bioreactor metagenome]|uniref:Uncharacterized protein n=1 Tax=bioreactor metagenome TaxID=1076179 RepID=A0A645ATW8_9ZZZZ